MNPGKTERSKWFAEEVLPNDRDLRSWLGARFPDLRDIDDLMQDTYSRLLGAYDTGPIANARAFMFVTARNLALNQIRHFRYERPAGAKEVDPLSIIDEITAPREAVAAQEDFQHLIAAIQSLPDRCRQVMTLRKIYGLSQKEAASRLGISVHTVETQVSIGLRKCTEYFKTHGFFGRNSP